MPFFKFMRNWLLNIHMLSRFNCIDGYGNMPMIGGCDHDGIDVLPGKYLLVTFRFLDVPISSSYQGVCGV